MAARQRSPNLFQCARHSKARRRIRGQVEAIERALDGEAGCAEIMHQIAGCRGAINSLLVEVVEDHIRTHLVDPAKNPEALDAGAAVQLIEVVHSYFK
jgi:DNA-binding FrmR family transcriptional regulator